MTATNTNTNTNTNTDSDQTPEVTYHYEPEFVGGKKYVRCEECDSESVPADPDEIRHHEGCSYRIDYS